MSKDDPLYDRQMREILREQAQVVREASVAIREYARETVAISRRTRESSADTAKRVKNLRDDLTISTG